MPLRSPRNSSLALVCALAICATRAGAASTPSQPALLESDASLSRTPQILVIFSDDASQSWIRQITDSLVATEYGPRRVSPAWFFEHLDAVRFQDANREKQFREALRAKYRSRRLDLVVGVDSNAINFVRTVHDDLWPGVPGLAANYAGRVIGTADPDWESSIAFVGGFDATLASLRSVFPDTAAVAMTTGVSASDRRRQAETAAAVRRAGLTFIDLRAPSLDSILAQLQQLPANTLLFIAGGQADANGDAIPTWRMCEVQSAIANRPAFMLGSQFVGCGIVGGLLRDYSKIGAVIGKHAAAIASEGTESSAVVAFEQIATLKFDARQLERWGVNESRLPPGSFVVNRQSSLWRDYRREVIVSAIAVVTQFALIVGLLYERRRRHRAEVDSRRSLAVAMDAERRAAVSALTGSIAHALNQPLGSILHNAYAAQMLLESNNATPEILQGILRDIRNDDTRAAQIVQRHRAVMKGPDTHPTNIHQVVQDGLALLVSRAAEGQVQIHAPLVSPGPMVLGDPVLLQQVIVNLVTNAIDAVAGQPPSRRRVDVQVAAAGKGVEIAVRDSGPGLAPELERVLFEPFTTTKPERIGIGLTIVRGIVEAHGGTINAKNNPDGGATFRFTLPTTAVA